MEFRSYFNVNDDLESQDAVEASIRSGVSFKGSQLLTLIFAIFIASLGLNTDSIPVIIGAMLISPLMGPIIGMGLGIGIQDYDLLKRGLKNIIAAVIGSLLTSALYFLISPQYEGASQLLARTSPSIYDVFVALFGGAAGILSIAAKNKGQVLPGVAIATSLMPPLCTAGYGLATWQMHFFFGALYLFFTNMVFILVATWIGVKMFRFKDVVYQNEGRAKKVKYIVYTVVGATVCVSTYLTVVMLQKNIFIDKAQHFVENEMVFPNTQVLNHKETYERGKRVIDVTLIGEALPKDSLQLAMVSKLDSVGLGGTILNIRQGFSLAANPNIEESFKSSDKFYELMQNELSGKQMMIDSLKGMLAVHKQFSDESVSVSPEIRVLFPSIKDIALSQMVVASVEHNVTDTVSMIFINSPGGLPAAERVKLIQYIEVRLGKKNIYLTVNPTPFPWPSKK
ncbi:MAG: TIGR00341 family protein [Muribaculaceae bacterium]|nr:TIGR00341 family protein [Muribaculaceae bacterium]MDE6026760.1 TIGR00341 family protein [Muribaculaceae bacterium]